MKFFPIQNKLYVVANSGHLFVVDIDLIGDDRFYFTSINTSTK